ncbi:Suppressor of F exclusion of phage T7 [Jannaschia seosinensis]|uniref:Suppressor of F exclusion of phage T7 n=1 Tax=Jannaschia seosinensis TaxID=313367 RepID=A0A0M7BC57_9RHOB|nr:FxsA family protein [Jannaschia seosinensis]CUH39404.1 Suppressor of F exclusion of phage T7 [Jannaschia seosinensis]
MWLFAIFVAVPILEIALFIQVGGWLGLWPTLAIVIATAALGTWLVRRQGLAEIARIQKSLGELRDPTRPLAHGAMILASGLLLLTPGFFTDALGFALLVPGVRDAVLSYIRKRIKVQSFRMGRPPHEAPRPVDPRSDVLEGEYVEVPPRDGPSGWTRH